MISPDLQEKYEWVIIIFTATSAPSMIPTIKRLRDHPVELWITLQKKYQASTIQRKLDLRSELWLLSYSDGDSMEDYLKKIEKLIMDLGSIGEEVPDKELIQIVLRNLPDSWFSFLSVYGLMFEKKSRRHFCRA